ncbi:MAG: AI-2E family transporter [Patescibacteria group bacterium]|nr:AI-2E family transporter [Patescibacteria group bacterium]
MPRGDKKININITTATILKVIIAIALIYFLKLTADILGLLLVSMIIALALIPFVDKLHERKIPRALSLVILYLLLFIFLSLSVYLIIPPIIKETGELANNLPAYIQSAQSSLFKFGTKYPELSKLTDSISNLNKSLESMTGGIIDTISSLFGGILSFLLVLIITFYIVAEEDFFKKSVDQLVPVKQKKRIFKLIDQIEQKVGYWLLGQFFLCFIIFLFTYIGLSLVGIKYALVLAIIAGVTEAIPYLGPIIASVPGILLALVQSPILAIIVAGMYFLIQQLENNILVPMVMKQAVGLNPIVSIVVLMIGFKLGGVMGAIIAIPVATIISVILKDYREYKKTL